MVEDIYLVGYGFVRGFLSGVLSRFGIVVSDMTLDFLAVILGHYLKARPGWQGLLGKIMYTGGLVSLGIEIGQGTGRRVADEVFSALPVKIGEGGGGGGGGAAATAGGGASPQAVSDYWTWRRPIF
jgi:hypothetical protein